jgi:hypothetical protein
LHRFQLEKILVQDFPLPLPSSSYSECTILPVFSLSNEKTNDFLIVMREERVDEAQVDEVEVYFASFSNKYLFKKFDLSGITLSCERVLTLSQLSRDRPLFAVLYQFEEGLSKSASLFRTVLIVGERTASICSMKLGRIEL